MLHFINRKPWRDIEIGRSFPCRFWCSGSEGSCSTDSFSSGSQASSSFGTWSYPSTQLLEIRQVPAAHSSQQSSIPSSFPRDWNQVLTHAKPERHFPFNLRYFVGSNFRDTIPLNSCSSTQESWFIVNCISLATPLLPVGHTYALCNNVWVSALGRRAEEIHVEPLSQS